MMTSESEPASTLRTRPSLLFRLRDWDDSASWEEFYRLYRRLVYGLAKGSGLSHDEAEDVSQDVFKRVAETIHDFEARPKRGSFRAWLMNLTRWRITDKIRARSEAERQVPNNRDAGDDRTLTIERIPDADSPDEAWEGEWRRHLSDAAFARIARRAKAKHFQIFDLYCRQQWPVRRISRELGVNSAAVYLINHRLAKQLKVEITKLRKQLG